MRVSTRKISVMLAEKELSLIEFSAISGIPYSTLYFIMKKKRNGNINTVSNIAKALNCNISDVLEE